MDEFIADPPFLVSGMGFTAVNPAIRPRRGNGKLAGTFPDGITSVDGEPTSATVRVLWRTDRMGDGTLVAEVKSDADGTWVVEGLDPTQKYDVIGRKNGYNDVIMANVSPVEE